MQKELTKTVNDQAAPALLDNDNPLLLPFEARYKLTKLVWDHDNHVRNKEPGQAALLRTRIVIELRAVLGES